MFTEVFYVGLYSALMGFVLAIVSQCYKSKCSQIDICCIKIIRDVEGEEALDRTPNPISQSQSAL